MNVVCRFNYKLFVLICLMFLYLTSCSNEDNFFMSGIAVKSRVKPDAEITLQPYETFSSDDLYAARSIETKIDSFLIFSTKSAEYSFMVYNENAKRVVFKFPNKGRGPDEQILSKITQVRRNNGSVEIDLLGLNEHGIMTIDLYRSIDEQHVAVIKRTELPQNTIYAHSFGESMAGIVLFDEYDYTLQLFNEDMERTDLILPFGLSVDPGFITSTCIMKEDGTKCLWAMQWVNKFNILDIDDLSNSASFSTSRKTVSDKQLYASISEMSPSSVTAYYTAAHATNNSVYLLYMGSPFEDVKRQMEIQNFDWDGHFKYRYKIEDTIDSFVVSEDESTVYGYAWDESKVYKYSLEQSTSK